MGRARTHLTVAVLAMSLLWPRASAQETGGTPVEQGHGHFDAGRFELAARKFEAAADGERDAGRRRTLLFNAAVAHFEAGNHGRAESLFVQIARAEDSSAPLARLNAGMCALMLGSLQRARDHLASANPQDEEGRARERQLQEGIDAAVARKQRRRAGELLESGLDALEGGRSGKAVELLGKALTASAGDDNDGRADVQWALAEALLRVGRYRAALVHINAALARRPDDPGLRLLRGRLRAQVGDDVGATADLAHAQAHGDQRTARAASAERARLVPLPPAGWQAGVSLAGGFDSNAAQSGTATTRTVATTESGSSGAATTALWLGYTVRMSNRWALGARYAGSAYLLSSQRARQLSLQRHEVWADATLAHSVRTSSWLSLGARLQLEGLDTMQPLTTGGLLSAGVDHGWTARQRTNVQLLYSVSRGHSAAPELSGHQVNLGINHGVTWRDLVLKGYAGIDANLISEQRVSLNDLGCVRCGFAFPNLAADPGYVIPLAYMGPVARLDFQFRPLDTLRLRLQPAYRYRSYLEQSGHPRLPGTLKRRKDHLLEAQGEAYWVFHTQPEAGAWLGYTYLRSLSNMNAGDGTIDNALDYANQTFHQHVALVGVRVSH